MEALSALLSRRRISFGYDGNISITVGELSAGLYVPDIMVLTEKEIFGERLHYRPMRKSKVSGLLTSLDDLRPGDFVVHKDHGIGRFAGTGATEHRRDAKRTSC